MRHPHAELQGESNRPTRSPLHLSDCTEVQSRGLVTADSFLLFKLWRSQFRSHGFQALHRFCDSRVNLRVPDTRYRHGRCHRAPGGKDADQKALPIRCNLRVPNATGSAQSASRSKRSRSEGCLPADGTPAAASPYLGIRHFPLAARRAGYILQVAAIDVTKCQDATLWRASTAE